MNDKIVVLKGFDKELDEYCRKKAKVIEDFFNNNPKEQILDKSPLYSVQIKRIMGILGTEKYEFKEKQLPVFGFGPNKSGFGPDKSLIIKKK